MLDGGMKDALRKTGGTGPLRDPPKEACRNLADATMPTRSWKCGQRGWVRWRFQPTFEGGKSELVHDGVRVRASLTLETKTPRLSAESRLRSQIDQLSEL